MANKVGFKSLNQIYSSTDVMYTDRRKFYLTETFLSNLWEDVTPFLTWTSQLNTRMDANDVEY